MIIFCHFDSSKFRVLTDVRILDVSHCSPARQVSGICVEQNSSCISIHPRCPRPQTRGSVAAAGRQQGGTEELL